MSRAAGVGLTGALLGAVLILTASGASWAQSQEQRALAAVRGQIESLQRRLGREHADRERQYEELKRIELDGAAATEALTAVRNRLKEQQGRGRDLEAQRLRAGQRLGTERDALASQVRMSFLAGRQETMKLMLNQESPARLGRMMTYYEYLNRARSRRIESVLAELATLAEIAAESERVTRELVALEREQQERVDTIGRLRSERTAAVVALDTRLQSDAAEIEGLRAEEQRLTQLVEELEAVLAEFPVGSQAPFSGNRGKLGWPIPGRLLSRFGEPRAGPDLRWRGVQVAAPAGTPVRSIYHGQVVYSDWLPGLGLLAIVDHGEGYMSLYGHNEALLKEAGDWVGAGEAIAQVGDSGGQAQTALYFEIRRNGEPVNPRDWMSRAEPGAR
ncbi:MAG TPA: peptidoglycan DD-metalloendopeptidase family protein [Gammaproteobacteria bacterium]|nr:peptidoglycan DD-metalloendopeptidase family protein [Gammaproteobacteria bacterium]